MENDNVLSNGTELTSYLATAYAERFCEGENASAENQLKAWAYLIRTGTCWSLQGWFGRTANSLIESGIISKKGVIDWDEVNDKLAEPV